MAHYDDLSPCDYFGATEGILLAVGWLDREHPFAMGTVPREVFDALAGLVADAWQLLAFAGRHPCGLCAFSGGPSVITVRGVTVPLGALNVFVPSSEGVYVAPSLVLHYVDAHGYAPPPAFQRAVMSCPPMRSMQYLASIRQHGIHHLEGGRRA